MRNYTSLTLLLILLWIIPSFNLSAQKLKAQPADSSLVLKHSPSKATIYSAILPGLGQVYNKSYWKIPIIYAGIGTMSYFIINNNNQYKKYKNLYFEEADKDIPNSGYLSLYESYTIGYRRNRDLSVIGLLVVWGLNVIEANVDAHFFSYDISPNLSLNFKPSVDVNARGESLPQLKLSVKF